VSVPPSGIASTALKTMLTKTSRSSDRVAHDARVRAELQADELMWTFSASARSFQRGRVISRRRA
jgi:hypothetical protein